jgi:RND family efflux transporter MFP subunit
MHRCAVSCFVLTTSVLFSLGCQGSGSKVGGTSGDASPVHVRVRKALSVKRVATVLASGSVEARETSNVAFQVPGKVARVLIEEGAAVRQGQPLAELDPTDYEYGLQAANGQIGMAEAVVRKAQTGARAQELERARIAFDRAEDEYRRMQQLYDAKALAPNDFKKIEAVYLAAREQYSEAREGARREDKAAARAAFEQAAAAARVARKRLADTRLLAPIAGMIARRNVNPGETVGAGMPVFTIVDLNPVKVRVGVPETDIARVRAGQAATILIPAMAERSFEGRVELVGVAAEPASRTYTVKILVPNPGHILRAGMIAEAQIRTDVAVEALTLPGEAVMRDPQGATLVYIYFPERKRVYARRVQAGGVEGREVEIRSGLKGGELVVVAGQQLVREGALVEAVEEQK